MTEKYLATFVTELRGYCAAINELTQVLRNPQVAAEAKAAATAELTRLFHTIAGLSSSLEISDFAGLAEGLEGSLLSMAANPQRLAGERSGLALINLLAGATTYLKQRLERMQAQGQYTLPAPEDEEPLRALEETLWQLSSQLGQPDAILGPPADRLSAEDLAILHAFSASDLDEAAQAAPLVAAEESPDRQEDHTNLLPGAKITRPLPVQPSNMRAPDDHAVYEQQPADETISPEMLELFRVETQDDLYVLQRALARLETPEERAGAVLEMRHVAHKIKGAAATLNLQVIASLSHCLEDILDLLRSRRLEYAPAVVDALLHGVIELERALRQPLSPGKGTIEGLERLRTEYKTLLAASEPERADDPAATHPDSRRLALAARQPQTTPTAGDSLIGQPPTETPHDHSGWGRGHELSLRVEVSRLDHLMGLVGELASNRANTDQARQELNESLAEVRRVVQKMNQLATQLEEEASPQNNQPNQAAPPALSQAPQEAHHLRQSAEANSSRLIQRDTPSLSLQNLLALTREEAKKRGDLDLEQFDSDHSHTLRALREGVNDIATISESLQRLLVQMNGLAEAQDTLTRTIQRDITHLRLVPLAQIFPRLQLTIRMVAQEQNKQINFQTSGASTEIDRDIIEAITDPLVQLVRNCAVHGIESVEARREQGKPEVGLISLHAYYSGNEVSIEIGDDGSGINHERLIEAAIASGKLSPEEAERLDPEQAVNLMLLPGISTSPEVTTIAGRGVGMDMVRTVVEGLRGTLHIHSRPGEGASFHIRLPISQGIMRALFVRAGDQNYAIPLTSIERIWQPGEQPALSKIAFFRLSALLGAAPPPANGPREQTETPAQEVALIVPLGHRQIGIVIDEVLAEREIVVKRLPPYLRRRGVRGVTQNPAGQLLLLLDLPELAHHALSGPPFERLAPTPDGQPTPGLPRATGPKVLVVDDSLFMRRTLELQLTRAGYQMKTARDGMEALQSILQERPSLVLLDIEMPQLDGYGVLSILRSRPQFSGIRVAMLTSRAANKHRQHALALGADAYLVKPCPHDVLLQTVANLVGR